jgi:LPXTG-motif cell wall-anchored protein
MNPPTAAETALTLLGFLLILILAFLSGYRRR